MGIRRQAKKALRAHVATCQSCRAADGDFERTCQEFRDALFRSATLGQRRRLTRMLARRTAWTADWYRVTAERDLEEARAEDRREEQALRDFIERTL